MNIKALRVLLWLVAALWLQPASAQTFPALSGRVVDAANIIPDDQEAALSAKLEALETKSTRQLVVATVPDLQGYPIEDYGYKLGRAWAIGQRQANNGTILLVAPNDRKVRIEVGYGLEPILTDAFTSIVINTQIIPQFKAGDFPAGIMAGSDALIEQLGLPLEQAEARAQKMAAMQKGKGDSGGAVLFWLFIFFFFILPMIWPLIFGRRRGRRFGGGPVIIWGGGNDWGGGSSGGFGGGSWGGGGGGFGGGGGSFGGGGSSGSW